MNVSELLASLGLTGGTREEKPFSTAAEDFSPASQNLIEAVKQMPEEQRTSFLDDLIKRLKIDMMYNQFKDEYTDGSAFGGRIGYTQPTGNDTDFTVGVSGSGYNVKTPEGVYKDYGLTGGDIGYRFGPNRLSANYQRYGAIGNEDGQIPVKDLVRLLYQRQF